MRSIQCCECSGFGHVRTDCPNFKNSKRKTMNATLSNKSESHDFDDSEEKNVSFMAFTVYVKSASSSSQCDLPVLVETCDEESQVG